MDVSKNSTAAYTGPVTDEVKQNIVNYWKQVEEEKIKKFNKELEEKGL